jgi:hypothetical protein
VPLDQDMTINEMWTLEAEELWEMGYRRCKPEPAPPMTRTIPRPMPKSALPRQSYREASEEYMRKHFPEREKYLRKHANGLRLLKLLVTPRNSTPKISPRNNSVASPAFAPLCIQLKGPWTCPCENGYSQHGLPNPGRSRCRMMARREGDP